jgi:myo-inositol-1(or 4)-monophosphatase
MNKSYLKEASFIIKHMKLAYKTFIFNQPRLSQHKGEFDIVTNIDLEIETYLIQKIKEHYPKDLILSEEMHSQSQIKNRTWTIDPIDGTFNFSLNIPIYGIQCSLIDEGKIVLGVIYLPHTKEVYHAIINKGSFLNNQRLLIKKTYDIKKSLISYGSYLHDHLTYADMQHQSIGKLYPKVGKIRMYGAACVAFGFVASGRNIATIALIGNVWDLAPGVIIINEAGGVVTNLKGEPYKLYDFGVVAAVDHSVSSLILESFDQTYKAHE